MTYMKAGIGTRAALIALMVVGSVGIWIGNPMLWLWITARLQSTQATMGPYALMLLGITLTAVVMGKGLSWLNRLYGRVTGTDSTVRVIVPWRQSLRDARHGSSPRDEDGRVPVNLLDVVMVVSVAIAVIALVLWFAIVQPAPPLPGGPGGAKG
jgi:hypothetical protein